MFIAESIISRVAMSLSSVTGTLPLAAFRRPMIRMLGLKRDMSNTSVAARHYDKSVLLNYQERQEVARQTCQCLEVSVAEPAIVQDQLAD